MTARDDFPALAAVIRRWGGLEEMRALPAEAAAALDEIDRLREVEQVYKCSRSWSTDG